MAKAKRVKGKKAKAAKGGLDLSREQPTRGVTEDRRGEYKSLGNIGLPNSYVKNPSWTGPKITSGRTSTATGSNRARAGAGSTS